MENLKNVALIGAALLFVGVFVPLLSVPIAGNVNYFKNGTGDGVIVLLLAVLTVVFAMTDRIRCVLFTGLASLGMLAFTFISLQKSNVGLEN